MQGVIDRIVLTSALVAACVLPAEGGNNPVARVTAFVKLDVKPPAIKGSLWLDRNTVEGRTPIDKNGDTDYTDGELYLARGPLMAYVNRQFLVMWDGKIHPMVLEDLVYDKRRDAENPFVKLVFSIPGYAADKEIVIASMLLADMWKSASTMISLTMQERSQVFVLGSKDYFDSRLARPEKGAQARFACAENCLGVELKTRSEKCPRCGGPIVPVAGARVPGAGYYGIHGGSLMPFIPAPLKLEGLLTQTGELRVYATNDALEQLKVEGWSGTARIGAEQAPQNMMEQVELAASPDGSHLRAEIPKGVRPPVRAICTIDAKDGKGRRMVDFHLDEVIEVSPER